MADMLPNESQESAAGERGWAVFHSAIIKPPHPSWLPTESQESANERHLSSSLVKAGIGGDETITDIVILEPSLTWSSGIEGDEGR
jgi:hypothetical protein